MCGTWVSGNAENPRDASRSSLPGLHALPQTERSDCPSRSGLQVGSRTASVAEIVSRAGRTHSARPTCGRSHRSARPSRSTPASRHKPARCGTMPGPASLRVDASTGRRNFRLSLSGATRPEGGARGKEKGSGRQSRQAADADGGTRVANREAFRSIPTRFSSVDRAGGQSSAPSGRNGLQVLAAVH